MSASQSDSISQDAKPLDQLMVELQTELHEIAQHLMRRERPDHTLQPTALVNEAYLVLIKQKNLQHVSRARFLAAAATTIRRLLVDHARKHLGLARGGGWERVTISDVEPGEQARQIDLLVIDEAMEKLAVESPRTCQVVEYRYFSGMTIDEIAEVLDVSARTVSDEWLFAKAWLRRQLG